MPRHAILMRGINLAAHNRVPMSGLREELSAAGFQNVRTYLQSGNIALDSDLSGDELADFVEKMVADKFGARAPSVARSAEQLRALIDANPFPDPAANEPKFYAVTFLSEPPGDAGLRKIEERVAVGDCVALSASGCEVYAWFPGGIHSSKLTAQLTDKKLGVRVATFRNWTTVLAVQDLLAG